MIVPGSFIVTPRIAYVLETELKLNVQAMRVRGDNRELDRYLVALHSSAELFAKDSRDQRRRRNTGTLRDRGGNLPENCDTAEVAARVGCTKRAITKAAAEARLIGELVDGRWSFTPENVDQWMATRKRD